LVTKDLDDARARHRALCTVKKREMIRDFERDWLDRGLWERRRAAAEPR
jgi:hypothetical protein